MIAQPIYGVYYRLRMHQTRCVMYARERDTITWYLSHSPCLVTFGHDGDYDCDGRRRRRSHRNFRRRRARCPPRPAQPPNLLATSYPRLSFPPHHSPQETRQGAFHPLFIAACIQKWDGSSRRRLYTIFPQAPMTT
jgi:hypothetical protein